MNPTQVKKKSSFVLKKSCNLCSNETKVTTTQISRETGSKNRIKRPKILPKKGI